MPLTDLERQVLAMERRRWMHQGAKDQAVHDELDGMSRVRYDQLLRDLLDRPEALMHDPQTVNRLRRLTDQRRRARSARRLAG